MGRIYSDEFELWLARRPRPLVLARESVDLLFERWRTFVHLALPLWVIYLSLLILNEAFSHFLGVIYNTVLMVYGFDFFFLPIVYGLFTLGWYRFVLPNIEDRAIPNPLKLSAQEKSFIGIFLGAYFFILFAPHTLIWLAGLVFPVPFPFLAANIMMIALIGFCCRYALYMPFHVSGNSKTLKEAAQAGNNLALFQFCAIALTAGPLSLLLWMAGFFTDKSPFPVFFTMSAIEALAGFIVLALIATITGHYYSWYVKSGNKAPWIKASTSEQTEPLPAEGR